MRIYTRHFPPLADRAARRCPVYPSYLSYNDNAPTWVYAMHSHTGLYEFAFAVEGEGMLNLETNEQALTAGDIVIMPPEVMHYYSSQQKNALRYYSLQYRVNTSDGAADTYLSTISQDPVIIHAKPYLGLITESLRLLDEVLLIGGERADALILSTGLTLYDLAGMLLRHRSMAIPLREQSYAHEVLTYITQHYAEHITLESLSQQFHISSSHLRKIFHDAYHISPIAHLINCRIAQATEFLLKSSLTVEEIARAVGYDNTTHFSKLFADRIGCTPSEFRSRNSV